MITQNQYSILPSTKSPNSRSNLFRAIMLLVNGLMISSISRVKLKNAFLLKYFSKLVFTNLQRDLTLLYACCMS